MESVHLMIKVILGISPTAMMALANKCEARAVHNTFVETFPEGRHHPSTHGAIAERIVEYAKLNNRNVNVVTHSELLVMRLRRMVLEEQLSKDDLLIVWIGLENNSTEPVEIRVDSYGSPNAWPVGMFDMAIIELCEMFKIQRARTKGKRGR